MTADDYIIGLRAFGFSEDDISDTVIQALIGEALPEYSRFRPQICALTFATVDGQSEYTWEEMGDAAGQSISTVLWNPSWQGGFDWLPTMFLGLGLPGEIGDWNLPSQQMLLDIKAAASQANFGGTGSQTDPVGGSLQLSPIPSGVHPVYILYTKPYSAIEDVKDVDVDIFADLLTSYCCTRVTNEMARRSMAVKIKTPEYERDLGTQLGFWKASAKDARQSFIDKCGGGYATGSRS
jgi:hypothetical protein